jgi:hypothetical protein
MLRENVVIESSTMKSRPVPLSKDLRNGHSPTLTTSFVPLRPILPARKPMDFLPYCEAQNPCAILRLGRLRTPGTLPSRNSI